MDDPQDGGEPSTGSFSSHQVLPKNHIHLFRVNQSKHFLSILNFLKVSLKKCIFSIFNKLAYNSK